MHSLNTKLHELVDGEPGSAPPIPQLLQRGKRARRRRTATIALSVMTAAGLATAVAIPLGPQQQPSAAGETAGQAVSPQIELVAALTNTENTSFKVHTVLTKPAGGRQGTYEADGAFDPATTSGYSKQRGGTFEVRLINGTKFVSKDGVRFVKLPGRSTTVGFDVPLLEHELAGSADSDRLFELLRRADAKITKTGDRTYHFQAVADSGSFAGFDALTGPVTLVGDVVLDGQQRIAKIEYEYRYHGFKTVGLLEFSDYGTPVRIEQPADVTVSG